MTANFVEELTAEYFRVQGYLVTTNYWFPSQKRITRTQHGRGQQFSQRNWRDIDVLAVNSSEVVLVQVKAIINEEKVVTRILNFFLEAEAFISKGLAPDGIHRIDWWVKGRKIKRLLIYEVYSAQKFLSAIREQEIEVKQFREIFEDIRNYIRNKKGVKEGDPTMRFIHFLNRNGFLPRKEAVA